MTVTSGSDVAGAEARPLPHPLAQRLDIEPTGAALPKPIGMVVNRPTGGALLRVAGRR